MCADTERVAIRWSHYALIAFLGGSATWFLARTLGDSVSLSIEDSTPLQAFRIPVLLGALCATLVALVFIVWRSHRDQAAAARINPWIFPIVCSLIALAMSAGGLNGSSSAQILRTIDGVEPSEGLILGEAKFIRSDEWMVHTPWLLSQARQVHPFSSRNPSVGGKHAPAVCNLPVAHWSTIVRPEFWSFFTGVRPETAFAFFWNFKWWSLLCGSYVLLLIITRGEPLLSAAGSLMLLWTSTIQWWFSSPTLMPDMLGLWCFALATGYGAVVHPNFWIRVLFSAGFVVCALDFLFCCYPPFQIPLATLFAPLFVVLLYDRPAVRRWGPITLASGLVIIGAAVFAWQLRDTISAIRALIYPGQRFSTGGEALWTSIAHGFVTLNASELRYPPNFANVVAASSFLNALPVLAWIHVIRRWRGQTRDNVQLVLLIFAALATLFAVCGIPAFIARITLWSYATAERISVTLALVNVLAVCRYLSARVEDDRVDLSPRSVSLGILVFGLILVLSNRELHNFVSPAALGATWLFFSVAGLFLLARFRFAAVVMILFPLAFLNGAINPLGRGLPAYRATSVSPAVADLHKAFPRTRWIVVGTHPQAAIYSALLKSTGATVLSGVIAVPNRAMLDGLDPEHANAPVYSRYAIVCFKPGPDSGVPEFELQHREVYLVRLPLTDRWLRAAGIDGVAVLDSPELPVPENYREVASVSGCRFWVREGKR